jgi:long-chain acyl-CoA synthetase
VNEAETAVQLIDTERLETNLADLVKRQLVAYPDEVALVQPRPVRRTVTWAQLDGRVDAVAAGLSAHGLVAGHRIALVGPNSIEFVIAYLATLRAGYVAVPINPESTVTELGSMIDDCGARCSSPQLPNRRWKRTCTRLPSRLTGSTSLLTL